MRFAFLTVVLFVSTSATAADEKVVSCVEVEQKLSAAQRSLATCNDSLKSTSSARDRCQAELADKTGKLEDTTANVQACVAQKEAQCQEAAVLAASLLQGTARGVASCIPSGTQQQIQALLDGWFGLSKTLAQLDEYATGNTDVVPRVSGSSEPERHLARVLGLRSGSPLWNRRLLIEAFKLAAPSTWSHLRGGGGTAIDTFFESQGPLPEAFISEANGDHPEGSGPAGTP